MGSLSSRPSVPSISTPSVVYVPSTSSSSTTETDTTSTSTSETSASELRAESLLSRDRSRYGTILNGFRGLLGLNNEEQKKTLLGE